MPSQSASSPFFGLRALPDRRLLLQGRGGDVAQLVLPGHVAQVHAVQHGRVDAAELAQLAYGADRQRQHVGDGLLGPALGVQGADVAPLVHRRHRLADDVLQHGAHPVVVLALVGSEHQHGDLLQLEVERGAQAAAAVADREAPLHLARDGRLQDADDGDALAHLLVGVVGRQLAPRVVRVVDQAARVDRPEFHVSLLLGSCPAPHPGLDPTHALHPGARGKGAPLGAGRLRPHPCGA